MKVNMEIVPHKKKNFFQVTTSKGSMLIHMQLPIENMLFLLDKADLI